MSLEGRGRLCVTNIGELLTLTGDPAAPLGIVRDAAVAIIDGRVVFAGREAELGPFAGPRLDAKGALVTPGLIEPHAHPIFAGFAGGRAGEFARRAEGASYAQIQAEGGGILATVRATCAASDEELIASTLDRLDRFLASGVTVCEAKSGYALTIDGELRLVRLLNEVARRHPIDLSPTLLAHVPPPDAKHDEERATWIRRFIAEAIPQARVDAVDVYCDEGAFTLDETRQLLSAARARGLLTRVHAEQFTHTGAAELAAELGARSVEHLEELSATAPTELARAGTVCNLLPGAALTLRLPFVDARRLIAAGCRVALGTDCNPGSSLSESLPLMMSLGCMQMGLRVDEAWLAVTRHAAYAVGRSDAGYLAPEARGDLVLWQTDDHRHVVQHLGASLVKTVLIAGEVAYHK